MLQPFTLPRPFAAVSLVGAASTLAIWALPSPAQIETVVNFDPPPQDAPGNLQSGGLRSDTCADTTAASGLMALVPSTNVGLTSKASPELFAYIPPNNAERAELRIFQESTGEEVYAGQVSLPTDASGSNYGNKSAVISMPLETAGVTLQPGENYLWALMLVCNGENRAEDIVVQVVVQQVGDDYISTLPEDVSKNLASVASASRDEKLLTYSSAGLWQDLLTELSTMVNTDTATYGPIWSELLTNQGLGAIANVPVYQSNLTVLSAN